MNLLKGLTFQTIASGYLTPHGDRITLRDYQQEALHLMSSGKSVSIKFPRQYGGSFITAVHILLELMESKKDIALISINYAMSLNNLNVINQIIFNNHWDDMVVSRTKDQLTLVNGSTIKILQRSDRGHKTSYDIIYFDEINQQQYAQRELFMFSGRQIRVNCKLSLNGFTTMHRGIFDFSDVYVDITRMIEVLGLEGFKREYLTDLHASTPAESFTAV